jgi:hypothetical protein
VLGEVLIFGKNILLELKRSRCWIFLDVLVRVVTIVVILMASVRVIMMMVAVLMAVISMRVAGFVIAGEDS